MSRKLSLALVISGMVLVVASFAMGAWWGSPAVVFPIDLSSSSAASPAFQVREKGEYLIELHLERTGDYKETSCLLGVHLGYSNACSGWKTPVDVRWTVRSATGAVASGASSGPSEHGSWGATIGRTLGSFAAQPGVEYVLRIESAKDASVLQRFNPSIEVDVHPFGRKGHALLLQGVVALGLLLVVVGTIVFVRRK